MSKERFHWHIGAGLSGGALNITLLNLALNQKEGLDIATKEWLDLSSSKIYKQWFPFSIIEGIWKSGIFSTAPMQERIGNYLKTYGQHHHSFVGATDLNNDSTKYFYCKNYNQNQLSTTYRDAVLASASFPLVFPNIEFWANKVTKNNKIIEEYSSNKNCPFDIEDKRFFNDGAVLNQSPITFGIDLINNNFENINNDKKINLFIISNFPITNWYNTNLLDIGQIDDMNNIKDSSYPGNSLLTKITGTPNALNSTLKSVMLQMASTLEKEIKLAAAYNEMINIQNKLKDIINTNPNISNLISEELIRISGKINGKKEIAIHIIAPSSPLAIQFLEFNTSKIEETFHIGYKDAETFVTSLKNKPDFSGETEINMLLLPGGGALSAFQIGVLQYFYEKL